MHESASVHTVKLNCLKPRLEVQRSRSALHTSRRCDDKDRLIQYLVETGCSTTVHHTLSKATTRNRHVLPESSTSSKCISSTLCKPVAKSKQWHTEACRGDVRVVLCRELSKSYGWHLEAPHSLSSPGEAGQGRCHPSSTSRSCCHFWQPG